MKICGYSIPGTCCLNVSLNKKDLVITAIALAALTLLVIGSTFLGMGILGNAAYYFIGFGAGLLALDILISAIIYCFKKHTKIPELTFQDMRIMDDFGESSKFSELNYWPRHPRSVSPAISRIETVHTYKGPLINSIKAEIQTNNDNPKYLSIVFNQHPDFSISIRCQDIFLSNAKVIVNAANSDPQVHHLGINRFIHEKAGDHYTKAHEGLLPVPIPEGYAYILDSYDLAEKNAIEKVIVVVGPQGFGPSRGTSSLDNLLYSCYYNSLALASHFGYLSIAFPGISTGAFGFDKNQAAEISIKAISDFIDRNPDTSLKTISIHTMDPNDLTYYQNATPCGDGFEEISLKDESTESLDQIKEEPLNDESDFTCVVIEGIPP